MPFEAAFQSALAIRLDELKTLLSRL
jgi:hypothetical protein